MSFSMQGDSDACNHGKGSADRALQYCRRRNCTNNTNWLTEEPISTWFGVIMDGSGRAARLFLGNNGGSGSLPGQSAL